MIVVAHFFERELALRRNFDVGDLNLGLLVGEIAGRILYIGAFRRGNRLEILILIILIGDCSWRGRRSARIGRARYMTESIDLDLGAVRIFHRTRAVDARRFFDSVGAGEYEVARLLVERQLSGFVAVLEGNAISARPGSTFVLDCRQFAGLRVIRVVLPVVVGIDCTRNIAVRVSNNRPLIVLVDRLRAVGVNYGAYVGACFLVCIVALQRNIDAAAPRLVFEVRVAGVSPGFAVRRGPVSIGIIHTDAFAGFVVLEGVNLAVGRGQLGYLLGAAELLRFDDGAVEVFGDIDSIGALRSRGAIGAADGYFACGGRRNGRFCEGEAAVVAYDHIALHGWLRLVGNVSPGSVVTLLPPTLFVAESRYFAGLVVVFVVVEVFSVKSSLGDTPLRIRLHRGPVGVLRQAAVISGDCDLVAVSIGDADSSSESVCSTGRLGVLELQLVAGVNLSSRVFDRNRHVILAFYFHTVFRNDRLGAVWCPRTGDSGRLVGEGIFAGGIVDLDIGFELVAIGIGPLIVAGELECSVLVGHFNQLRNRLAIGSGSGLPLELLAVSERVFD